MVAIVERMLGLLAVLAVLVAIATLVALVVRRVPPWLREIALAFATAIALVATAGSLFFSEVAGYVPCELCWYQRIAMYPLTVVLGVAAIRGDRQVWRTAVPIAALGSVISIWHIAIERNPLLGGDVCDPAAPCAVRWVEEFGVLTLPTMALIGFVAIIVLTLAARPSCDHDRDPHPNHDDHTTPLPG